MFDVRGNTIYFNLHPFAKVQGAPWIGLELDAIGALLDYKDQNTMIPESEHYEAVKKAEDEGYNSGHADGLEAGAVKCEKENRDEWEKDAAERAVANMATDDARANQVERVEALMLALKTAHDALHAPVIKRYPAAKIKECKDAMRAAMTTLRLALNAYNAPNGA